MRSFAAHWRGAASFGLGAGLGLLALSCKPKPPPADVPEASTSASASASASAEPPPAPSASASATPLASAKPETPAPHTPGPTAEAVLQEAKQHVEEAIRHAQDHEPCPEVLPLLDVSYSIAHKQVVVDEPTLAIFARCAAEHQRWRLLHDLAEAIAAGERKLETTYFMPRAEIGLGAYPVAHTLSKAMLRAWPTEGEAYDTAALAALRMKDWDGAVKAADQALLLLRKHNTSGPVTALAHGLRGAGLLHMGKVEEGVREIEAAKAHEGVLRVGDATLEMAKTAKEHSLVVSVDLPSHAYPALWPLYTKKVAPLTGLATVSLQNVADKPAQVVIEVTFEGGDALTETETLTKGHPVVLNLTPELSKGSPLESPKTAEAREVTVTVSGALDHAVFYKESRKVSFEPRSSMPKVLRSHGEDLRSAFALEAAWVTATSAQVLAVVEAAKARLHGSTKFDGVAGASIPQVQAIWDELRARNVAFHRDPKIDTETRESISCKLPDELLAAGTGNAMESSVLLASLLEAIGLDVILVRTPGHRMVGWIATNADLAAPDTAAATVKSPRGQAFFIETTTVGEGPLDAAILRGAANWVAVTNDGSVTAGRAAVEGVNELRHKGIAAHTN